MYKVFKRLMDFIISFCSILILLPLFFVIALLIKCTSKGPVIFKQLRVGKNNKVFHIFKFRTMKVSAPKDCPTKDLEDPYQYITKVGRFLRKTSLDELPQLFNVLNGTMSIIGPRPVVLNEVDLLNKRHELLVDTIKPGITGWAQVHGRDSLSFLDKALLDQYYVNNLSLALDLKCLFSSFKVVLTHEGVIEGNESIKPKPIKSKKTKKIVASTNESFN